MKSGSVNVVRAIACLMALGSSMVFVGCTKREKATGKGALIGGIAGTAVGGVAGKGVGAAIGAGAGSVVGGLVGNKAGKNKKDEKKVCPVCHKDMKHCSCNKNMKNMCHTCHKDMNHCVCHKSKMAKDKNHGTKTVHHEKSVKKTVHSKKHNHDDKNSK